MADVDFDSWQSFYDGDTRRRANEVKLSEVADGEFWWRITWFPTMAVVAWPFRWRDERWHGKVRGQTHPRTPQPSTKAMGPAPLPEMIYVVGRADSAEEGGAALRRDISDLRVYVPAANRGCDVRTHR
jgi:hypothetical protein